MNTQLKESTPSVFHQDTFSHDLAEQIKMMLKMGLDEQINLNPAVKQWRLEQAVQNFPQLSTYDIYLFKTIFPDNTQDIISYNKEKIPETVIKNLYIQHEMNIFERIELWQPAKKIKKDPMLVGIIEPCAFMLGLWGEPKIDIEEMEKTILGNMYEVKDRIKAIINKSAIQSLSNKLEIYTPDQRYFCEAWHCSSQEHLNDKRIYFSESNPFHTVIVHKLALCPICNKIINTAPTAAE